MMRGHRKGQARGRSGGRGGGSGHDFQDIYVALQLAKLLVGDPDPPVEILWEKKAVDWGNGAEPVHVDDVIIHTRSGKKIYVQVKETAPSHQWSIREVVRSGILAQFWREWEAKSPDDRATTSLRLASGGNVSPLTLIVDASRRARTPDEMLSDETSGEVVDDLKLLGEHLGIDPSGPILLAFLQSIDAEQLPAASELEGLIAKCLAAAGADATDLSNRLVRLVAQSKHAGATARSSFGRDCLVKELRANGVADDTLIAVGVLGAKPFRDPPVGLDIGGTSSRSAGEAVDEYARHFSDICAGIEALVSTTVETKDGSIESAQLVDRLSKDTHYVIVGKSGTGKTHLAKHMALQAISRRVVPILLRACDYRGEFSVLLDKSVAHSHPGTALDFLNSAHEAGRQVVLIVDGFNECTERLKESLIQGLQAFYLRSSIPITITSQTSINLPSVLKGDTLNMKGLSAAEKKAVFASYSKGPIHEDDVERFSEAFQTSYEISLAAQCVDEIRDAPTRTGLFQAYVRRHCETTANPAVTHRILCELAKMMGEQLVGSLLLDEVSRMVESLAAREGVSVGVLDELLESRLLEVGQGYCAFRHELLGQFFQALAFVRINERTNMTASELAKPRHRHLAEFVVCLQTDADELRSCVQQLAAPTMVADCLRGHIGTLARDLVSKDVADLFAASHRQLNRADLDLDLKGRILAANRAWHWTKYDQAVMMAIGLVLSDEFFFDETVSLIRHTDRACEDNLAEKFSAKKAELFASLYVFTFGDDRNVFPASVITNAVRQDYHRRHQAHFTEKVRALCEKLDGESPGILHLICLLLQHSPLLNDEVVARSLPALLRICWDTRIYHLRLEVLHVVNWFGRHVAQPIRSEIEAILSSLDWEGNIFLSTSLVEAMGAFGLLEPITTSEEIKDNLFRIIEDPDSRDAQQEAYSAASNVFEEIYDNLYWEAIKSLPDSDQVKLLTMASLGAPDYGMITPSWILEELIRLNDPNSLPAFWRFATEIASDTSSTQETAECFYLGVMGCAQFLESPPLPKRLDTPDRLAWQLYGEVIFWTNKRGLDEAEVEVRCAPLWRRLQNDVPLAAVDPLMQLRSIPFMGESTEKDPVRNLFSRWREPIRQILESNLDSRDSFTSLFSRGDLWFRQKYPAFMIAILGEVGNSNTVRLLAAFIDSADLGAVAVEAVRKLKARLR